MFRIGSDIKYITNREFCLRPTGSGGRCLTAEFLVLRGEDKSLRNDVEVFEAVGLLHSLDVFIETVFARQFI